MRPTRRSSTERRTSTRADAHLSMRLDAAVASGAVPEFVTETQNISASGVYCYSPHYLAPLSKVGLTLVLPPLAGARRGDQLLKCEAVVVRCQQASKIRPAPLYELACSFLGMEDGHRRLLDDYVTYRNLQALAGEARQSVTAGPRRAAKKKAAKKAPAARRKAAVRATARKSAARAVGTRKTAAKRATARRPASRVRKKK
jgi:hypothetical protein